METCIYIGLENKTAGIVSLQLRPSVLLGSVHGSRPLKQPQLTEERSLLRPRRKDSEKTGPERKWILQMFVAPPERLENRDSFLLESCERREAGANERKKVEAERRLERGGTRRREERLSRQPKP